MRKRAVENGQLSAAINAIREKGVLSGKRIERSEVGAPGEFDSLSDDELWRALIERLARLGFVGANGAPTLALESDARAISSPRRAGD